MHPKDKMQDLHKAIEIMQNAAYCVLSASPSSVCDFEPEKAYDENSDLADEYRIQYSQYCMIRGAITNAEHHKLPDSRKQGLQNFKDDINDEWLKQEKDYLDQAQFHFSYLSPYDAKVFLTLLFAPHNIDDKRRDF